MILLSITMFILGVLAFTDSLFNYGNSFRMIFSALLIVMSVWVYLKTKNLDDLSRSEIVSTGNVRTISNDNQDNTEQRRRERKPETIHH